MVLIVGGLVALGAVILAVQWVVAQWWFWLIVGAGAAGVFVGVAAWVYSRLKV